MNGTKDEYVTIPDLLADLDALQFRIDRPENDGVLTSQQHDAVHRLLAVLDDLYPSLPEWQSHAETTAISTDPTWMALRASANAALRTFGLDAEGMSPEEIEELSD